MCINVDGLSQYNFTDFKLETPSSSNRRTTHVTSIAAKVVARYLASAEDLETVFCFFNFHMIGKFPNKRMYPVTERLVSK